jgi:ribokinase
VRCRGGGGANTDYLARGPRLPTRGTAVEGNAFYVGPGGKGATQAVAAARLGASVTFLARLGRDEHGESLMAHLTREGVDTRYLVRDPQVPIGVALLQVDEQGDKQRLSVPGANRHLTMANVQAAEEVLTDARVMLTQLEVPLEAVIAAVRFGHAPPRLQRRGRGGAGRQRGQPARLARKGTLAAKGAGGQHRYDRRWRCVRRGAGDAFGAALAVSLAKGRTLEEAGPFESAAAALATTGLGA